MFTSTVSRPIWFCDLVDKEQDIYRVKDNEMKQLEMESKMWDEEGPKCI